MSDYLKLELKDIKSKENCVVNESIIYNNKNNKLNNYSINSNILTNDSSCSYNNNNNNTNNNLTDDIFNNTFKEENIIDKKVSLNLY